ncbi:nuclear condensin complex subunit Smc4 [Purpureocillium lavendulum]|uniref:Nuclear condensin complex subunit Smc4 n=1 Tax=Purpureocillium lavendulum TaxID=1247861 RepID=A0AB34FNX1_9HYPO|nr:nuclear condensin complex subunit Smc4 [Purpureocillium lavendulum]
MLATTNPANESSGRSQTTLTPTSNVPVSSSKAVSSTTFANLASSSVSTPTFITPTGSHIASSSFNPNVTATSVPTLPAANFTQVTRTGDLAKETCYHLPEDPMHGQSRRAMLHNTDLREHNATIPFPYVESVDFAVDGVDPLFLTLRDAAQGTHYLDVSNRSYISLVDFLGNAVLLDGQGIHFSTNSCRYDVSILVNGLYEQLADLSGEACSKGGLFERMDDMNFNQTLYLHDQCGHAVKRSIRKYPLLKVGDTECNDIDVDESLGKWVFDCTFPGSGSGTLRCQRAVRSDIFKFLFVDPFGGACPDLSTVITTLEATSQDFLNAESLRSELYNQGLTDVQRREVDLTVMYYEQLWEILKQALSKKRALPPAKLSAVEQYIETYDSLRNFEEDVCEDLHAGDLPLKMSLRAGVTVADAIATLNWAPREPKPYNVTVQDPDSVACCANGSKSSYGGNGTCTYPDDAFILNTGCVCGETASGEALAFEYTECDNFMLREPKSQGTVVPD